MRDRKTLTIPRARVIMVKLEREGTLLCDSDYECIKEALIARLMSELFPDSLPAAALAS